MTTKFATTVGAAFLCVSAACGIVALAIVAADVFARYALGRPFAPYGLLDMLVGASVMIGAGAALYVFRDPAAPPGPRWLGWLGGALLSLIVTLALIIAVFALARAIPQFIRAGDITTDALQIPIWLALAPAAFGCVVALGFALAGTVLSPWRLPVIPVAAMLLAAAFPLAMIARDFSAVVQLSSEAFRRFETHYLPVLSVGAIAGAVAAVKGPARVAALAAPALAIALVGIVSEISIGKMIESGVAVFLLMAGGHALLGLARGFRAAADDLIGLAFLIVSIPPIVIGVVTPTELWSVLAVIVGLPLVAVAAGLRRENAGRALAQGWGYGVGAMFMLVAVLVLGFGVAMLGTADAIATALAPILSSPIAAGPFLIVATTLVAAVLGLPAGAMLVLIFLMPGAVKAGVDPATLGLAVACSAMAGGCLFGWLAPRLTMAKAEDCTPVPAREAVLGAVPPLVAALLVWFVPDLLLRFD